MLIILMLFHPARVTDLIHDFFIALDLVAEDVQDIEESEDDGEDDQENNSPNAESECTGSRSTQS